MAKGMLTSSPTMEMPKQISIREADGGYIVSSYDMSAKDKVYDDLAGVHACIDEKFGKKKKKKSEED